MNISNTYKNNQRREPLFNPLGPKNPRSESGFKEVFIPTEMKCVPRSESGFTGESTMKNWMYKNQLMTFIIILALIFLTYSVISYRSTYKN